MLFYFFIYYFFFLGCNRHIFGGVSERGIVALSKLPQLKTLVLSELRINGWHINFKDFQKLNRIEFYHCNGTEIKTLCNLIKISKAIKYVKCSVALDGIENIDSIANNIGNVVQLLKLHTTNIEFTISVFLNGEFQSYIRISFDSSKYNLDFKIGDFEPENLSSDSKVKSRKIVWASYEEESFKEELPKHLQNVIDSYDSGDDSSDDNYCDYYDDSFY